MTDPDAPTFRAAQSSHAQELKAVHILTKTFGCTRSQARAAIRLTEAQRSAKAFPDANAGNNVAPLFQPGPQRSETKIEAPPAARPPIPPEPLLVPPGFGGGAGAPGGFKCVVSGSNIRVFLGLVNNILPTGMVLGDVTPKTVTPAGSSGYVVLKVTVSNDDAFGDGDGVPNGEIVSATISAPTSMPADSEPDFYLALGTYGAGPTVTPGGAGNGVGDQQFELCGGLGGDPKWGPA